ncbi:ankyrin repeat protein [Elysia marginata]|uniref:Ankyrin repeat protein n=1 Tax=Elysia marginata TaxID=1093978 RepID=A0AAV4JSL2_9GAST|nr:ankyrin repeat protein [Elysia marginata]
MVRHRVKGSKHKLTPSDGERVTRSKKAHLSDYARLSEAINCHDNWTVRNILADNDAQLSNFCLNAALLTAVEQGKKQIVQLFLNHGLYVSGKTGSLALVAAAERGYFDIVKRLIEKGAPVDGKNSAGKTALMVAVEKSCCSALVCFLIDGCKADINLQDSAGRTALMLAVQQWDYESVQALFMSKYYVCDESIKDKDGLTALDLAMKNGSAGLMKLLSQSCKEEISPLSFAAERNSFDLACELIKLYPSCVECHEIFDSPLFAAMHGLNDTERCDEKIRCSLELVDLLLQAGVDVNKEKYCGFTPLMFAVRAGSEKAVQMLLWYGARTDQTRNEKIGDEASGQTALMMAARKGFVRIIDVLLEAGADVYQSDNDGDDALSLAIKGGHRLCIQALLKHWKTLSQTDINLMEDKNVLDVLLLTKDNWSQLFGDTLLKQEILCKAVQRKSYQLVIALVDYGVDINSVSNTSCPLFLALEEINMVKLILHLGAGVNTREMSTGYTALMQAAVDGNVLLINTLLEHEADMYLESLGSTALTLACMKNKTKAVMALLDGGMDVNHVTQTKISALWCALTAKDFYLTETLIKRGANVNFAATSGVTVLMHALETCTPNFSKLLVNSGADVNAEDTSGSTALFYATRGRLSTEETFLLLLQHGADVNHADSSTKTVFMEAVCKCNFNIFKVLLASHPRINIQDCNGDNALHSAVTFCNDNEIVKALVSSCSDTELNMVNHDGRTPLMIAVRNLNLGKVEILISRGANFSFNGSPQMSQRWTTDFDFLCRAYNLHDSFFKCMERLLKTGWSMHNVQAYGRDNFLGLCIVEEKHRIVRLLLQSGVGPNILDISSWYHIEEFPFISMSDAMSDEEMFISPLKCAIFVGNPKIIALMCQACFYCPEDVALLQKSEVRTSLEEIFADWPQENCFSVEELYPENWSLRTWSKLAVLRAIGYSESKERRVRALPIPKRLQDELLHQHIFVTEDFDDEVVSSNSSQNANTDETDEDDED